MGSKTVLSIIIGLRTGAIDINARKQLTENRLEVRMHLSGVGATENEAIRRLPQSGLA
jgi:hypothetical protein